MEEKLNLKKSINKFFTVFMMISLSMMVILVFINAVMRYAFNTSIPVSEEYARFFFMWTTFLGVIAAFKDKDHVSVTILSSKLKGKNKKMLSIVAQILTLITLFFLLYGGTIYTISASSYKTVSTGINFGIIASGIVVMTIGSIGIVVRDLFKNIRNKEEEV